MWRNLSAEGISRFFARLGFRRSSANPAPVRRRESKPRAKFPPAASARARVRAEAAGGNFARGFDSRRRTGAGFAEERRKPSRAKNRLMPSADKFRHIVVEGPIGAGKTSLARRLAARLSADLILEQPADNPFLARFYQDMARYALPAQLFFLFQRARILEPLAQPDMFGRAVVADFLIDKDPLFARITLSGDEMALYQKIFDALRPQVPAPDLVIYLQAQPATLIERVRRRAAGYERGISEEYLALLAESYARFFYHYAATPVLIVNSENLNFVDRDQDFELLVSRMRGMKSRREFFSLG